MSSRTNIDLNVALLRTLTAVTFLKRAGYVSRPPKKPWRQRTDFCYVFVRNVVKYLDKMREIVHIQAGQCGNQIGAKVRISRAKVIGQDKLSKLAIG